MGSENVRTRVRDRERTSERGGRRERKGERGRRPRASGKSNLSCGSVQYKVETFREHVSVPALYINIYI